MKQKPTGRPSSSEQIIRDIKRKTRKQYNAEEKAELWDRITSRNKAIPHHCLKHH